MALKPFTFQDRILIDGILSPQEESIASGHKRAWRSTGLLSVERCPQCNAHQRHAVPGSAMQHIQYHAVPCSAQDSDNYLAIERYKYIRIYAY
jgi:hypothetical protein